MPLTETEQRRAERHPRFIHAAQHRGAWRKLIEAVESTPLGGFFFTRGAVDSFKSYPSGDPIATKSGRIYFATSEDFGDGREWRTRCFDPETGVIETLLTELATSQIAQNALGDAMREAGDERA